MTLAPTKPDHARDVALLKAIGLDRLAPEQRELALNIAARYDLDLLLKHLVMIEGRPFITRDGLLHIAHRSGVFDGMETSDPTLQVPGGTDGFWHATCSVYRKDMSRPFTYSGRYPAEGRNKVYAPEMAVKVAESMALRRAFDVAAPSVDEKWDADEAPAVTAPPPRTLGEAIAAKKATLPSEQGHDDEPPDLGPVPVPDEPPPPIAPGQVAMEEPVTPLTGDEFKAILKANRIAPAYAFAEAQAQWPEVKTWEDLNGVQLAELADFLTATKDVL